MLSKQRETRVGQSHHHMSIFSNDGDVRTLRPDLWRLLTINPEGEQILTDGELRWHPDFVDNVEVEMRGGELSLLIRAVPASTSATRKACRAPVTEEPWQWWLKHRGCALG